MDNIKQVTDNSNQINEQKKALREQVLDIRRGAASEELEEKSARICDIIIELPEYKAAEVIMTYMDFRNEVSTGRIISESIARGKRIALPLITQKNGEKLLEVYYIRDLENELIRCKFGILEPDAAKAERVRSEDIGIVLVPGAAFDSKGTRLGYGAGYYDRFLAGLSPDIPKIGMAFEFQLLASIPADGFDIAMDMIVTENGSIRCR
ncbi:MAG: 5-formyltetrahydrofolate cyclo-ligase [Clostridiales bacterium]|nr:5-formyltetrahydrofolate cyclo-ligase [Clostridiales bacterium]